MLAIAAAAPAQRYFENAEVVERDVCVKDSAAFATATTAGMTPEIVHSLLEAAASAR